MKYIYLLQLILLTGSTFAQITFNRIYQFDYEAAVLTSIIETTDGYDAIGIFVDSIPYNRNNNIFVKFDLEGNIQFQKEIIDSTISHEIWEAPMIKLVDGGLAASGYSIGQTTEAILIRYTEIGDTLSITKYLNPFHPDEIFIHPRDLIQTADSGFISLNTIGTPGFPSIGIQMVKFDALGNIEWYEVYGTDAWERPLDIQQDDDGGYLIGAWRTNFNTTNQYYRCQSWLIKSDSLGVVEWEWLSPKFSDLQEGVIGLDQLDDGSYIIASGRGIEYPVNPGTGEMRWDGLFYKLDSAGNVVWETSVRGSRPFSTADRFTRMVSCSDGSGYVACGTKLDTFTIDGVFESGRFGWLAKVSPQGDSLWSRYYSYVHPANAHSQTFYDLKETSDGGFIMAGESKELITVIGYPQSGWLVKVDQYGCLVPGCHLVSNTSDPEKTFTLSLYPNPARDFLNVFYRNHNNSFSKSEFRVVNVAGQEMIRYTPNMMEVTFMIPVWHFPKGMYYLQYWKAGELLQTEGFVVSR